MHHRKHNWYSSFYNFDLSLTKSQVLEMSGPRECGPAVESVLDRNVYVSSQFAFVSDAQLQGELRETGGWEPEELQDRRHNIERVLWLAATQIREEKGWR